MLSGRDLGLGVEILDLGFTENTVCNALVAVLCRPFEAILHVGVASWGLVNLRVVDDEEDLAEINQHLYWNWLQQHEGLGRLGGDLSRTRSGSSSSCASTNILENTNVLWSSESNAGNTRDSGQSKLGN